MGCIYLSMIALLIAKMTFGIYMIVVTRDMPPTETQSVPNEFNHLPDLYACWWKDEDYTPAKFSDGTELEKSIEGFNVTVSGAPAIGREESTGYDKCVKITYKPHLPKPSEYIMV